MPAAKLSFQRGFLLTIILMTLIASKSHAQTPFPLINAFAHNDYFHKRPLFDALDNGYHHIEADVYLRRGKLIVAHIFPVLSRKRELENMYFKPLQDCVNGANKDVILPSEPVTLMIDIKSGADETYRKIQALLDKYKGIISSYENGQFIQRQITVVISGHKPEKLIRAEDTRMAFIDADLMKEHTDSTSKAIYQMASCKYSKLIKWTGKGNLPESQRERLCSYVKMAHQNGEKVRLWASPDNNIVWKELLSCGVDLINTDKLVKLKNFLLQDKNLPGTN